MDKDYDVIVIGAGNGGLFAGAFTAKNGFKTLVVDQHNLPGGSATSFVRGRFEFETSLHELCQLGPEENPGGVRKLFNMLGSDVEWLCHMGGTFRLVIPEEGIDAEMPCGVENFCRKMEELVPGSGQLTGRFFQLAMMAAQGFDYIMSPEYDPEVCKEKFPDYLRLAGHTIREVLDSIGMPKKAQVILSTYWAYLGGTVDETDFLTYARMVLAYVVYGSGQPRYRSHEISLSLEKVIRDHGGEVWYNTEISKVLVKDGKAYGVVIDGKEYLANQIVSNAYPNHVYGYMIDANEVPEGAIKLINSRELGISFVTVYLGMNRTADELGITSYTNFVASDLDSVDQKRKATNTNDYCGYSIMNCLNKIIPDCTPEGTCQLFFTTFVYGNGWDNLKPEEYNKQKNKVALEMIEHCERALGITIQPYIEEIVIAAPQTFARYLNSPQGTPYGYQMTMQDSYILRSSVEARKDDKFIDNLHFVGAATHRGDGYSSAYLSGIDAGMDIVRAEKEKGGMAR